MKILSITKRHNLFRNNYLATFMNKAVTEKNIVVVLFVFVMVLFSFADKDSKKLKPLYTENIKAQAKIMVVKSSAGRLITR